MAVAKATILVIDDDRNSINLILEALETEYKILVAKNAERGIEIANTEPKPQLILLDILMPEMNGYEACEILKSDPETTMIPIIFLSAISSVKEEIKGLNLGAVDFIRKPMSPPIVSARVKTHIALRQHQLDMEQRFDEHIHAEKEIRKLNKQLKDQAVELQASNNELEAFSYSVAHDLRAPLRTISGFSNILLEEYAEKLETTGQGYLSRVRDGCLRMSSLIDDMLALSRITRKDLKIASVDLSKLAKKTCQLLANNYPDQKIELHIQEDIHVMGDVKLLSIALANLFDNAWKFTSRNKLGEISFSSYVTDQGEQAYSVSDNGAGFDMHHTNNLFGPFQRLHDERDFPGTGIGLATVQRIIQRHGGKVWAKSQPQQGAAFYFTLP